jgi:hypothetical protein
VDACVDLSGPELTAGVDSSCREATTTSPP